MFLAIYYLDLYNASLQITYFFIELVTLIICFSPDVKTKKGGKIICVVSPEKSIAKIENCKIS